MNVIKAEIDSGTLILPESSARHKKQPSELCSLAESS